MSTTLLRLRTRPESRFTQNRYDYNILVTIRNESVVVCRWKSSDDLTNDLYADVDRY
ncbi:MAG: hypothetical protein WBB28_27730 [Crinalium sp.]